LVREEHGDTGKKKKSNKVESELGGALIRRKGIMQAGIGLRVTIFNLMNPEGGKSGNKKKKVEKSRVR